MLRGIPPWKSFYTPNLMCSLPQLCHRLVLGKGSAHTYCLPLCIKATLRGTLALKAGIGCKSSTVESSNMVVIFEGYCAATSVWNFCKHLQNMHICGSWGVCTFRGTVWCLRLPVILGTPVKVDSVEICQTTSTLITVNGWENVKADFKLENVKYSTKAWTRVFKKLKALPFLP